MIEHYQKVAFSGVEGSFTEEALTLFFKNNAGQMPEKICCEEFEDVFEAIRSGRADAGVLPLENSTTGSISATYDLLLRYGFYIKGEQTVSISHCLLGIPGATPETIKTVYSHSQGFEQSRGFLSAYPSWRLIPHHNTAISAKYVRDKDDETKAAIAAARAAEIYGLEILKEKIEDEKDNTTRFIIISKDPDPIPEADKVSLLLSLKHSSGSLYELLGYFAENGINLVKIESRPIKGKKWQYMFYLDFEGNVSTPEVKKAMELAKKNTDYFRLLGSYKKNS